MESVWFSLQFYLKNVSAESLFTDTDSLTYEIKSQNVYKKYFKWKDLFDSIQKIQSF